MSIITIANQKGGVGKTSISINLSHGLAKKGCKTLVIDMDPQFNLSFFFLGSKLIEYENKNIGNLLINKNMAKEDILSNIIQVRENLYLLPSHLYLSVVEKLLINEYAREFRLKNIIEKIREDFDFIIIDNPPSLGLFMINSLVASDYVIIPCEPSYFSIAGAQLILDTIEEVKNAKLNENIKVLGFIFNKYTKQTKVSIQRLNELRQLYPEIQILGTISKSVIIEKLESQGKTIFDIYLNNKIIKEFEKIIEKVMDYGK